MKTSITDKTRKKLWAKSGNRCALCKAELVGYEGETFNEVIIGEECHIVSGRPSGPRYNIALKTGYDDYENLLLLCRNHHKIVDEQVNTYTVEQLILLKVTHETWVKETLNSNKNGSSDIQDKLHRLTSGKELVNVINSVHGYSFDHDEVKTEEEATIIAVFFENMENYGDLIAMGSIDSSAQVKLGMEFNNYLSQLENLVFWRAPKTKCARWRRKIFKKMGRCYFAGNKKFKSQYC